MIVIIIIAVLLIVIGPKNPSPPSPPDPPTIKFEFKDVGELVTQEWYGRMLEDSSKDRKILNAISIPFTESRLIFSIDVEVLAAVDFEDIEYEISDKKEKVIVTLPHSEVYKAYEVQNSFVAYLDEESWFTNIDATEQQKLKDKIVEKGKKQAIESGMLEKADKNAKNTYWYWDCISYMLPIFVFNKRVKLYHDTAEDLKGQKPYKSSCLLLGVVF